MPMRADAYSGAVILLGRLGVRYALVGIALVGLSLIEYFRLRVLDPWLWEWQAALGAAAITVAFAVYARHPAAAVALVCVLTGGSWVLNDGLTLMSYVGCAVVISYLVGRWAEQVRGVVVVVIVAAVALTALQVLLQDVSWRSWFGEGAMVVGNLVLYMGVPWLSGRYLRQVARTHSSELEQVQLRERARIAQEMHDSIGHKLSLIAVRAGALQVAPGLAGKHQRAAGAIRVAAASATERLGEIVGVLRPAGEEAPLHPSPATIAELVDRARDSGLRVRLDGAETGLTPKQQAAAHRVVQEALTNASRHSPGSLVSVQVETGEDVVRVSITNGSALKPARPIATSRQGLAGLQEAARAAAGSLRHGPTADGGFQVVAEFPVTEDVHRIDVGASR